MVRVRKERSTSTSAIIIDYDKFMEMYNIDFRRGEIPAENVTQSAPEVNEEANTDINAQQYKPGSIPLTRLTQVRMGINRSDRSQKTTLYKV